VSIPASRKLSAGPSCFYADLPSQHFSRESDLPLMIGLLVDTRRSQEDVMEPERRASLAFLEQVLQPGHNAPTPSFTPSCFRTRSRSIAAPQSVQHRVFAPKHREKGGISQDQVDHEETRLDGSNSRRILLKIGTRLFRVRNPLGACELPQFVGPRPRLRLAISFHRLPGLL